MRIKIIGETVFWDHVSPRLAKAPRKSFRSFGIKEVKLGIEGNFTVVIISSKIGDFAGVAKRDPNMDEIDINRGIGIAASRAFGSFLEYKNVK